MVEAPTLNAPARCAATWLRRSAVAAALAGAVFIIVAASQKLVAPEVFRLALERQGVLPAELLGWAKYAVPVGEVAIAAVVLSRLVDARLGPACRAISLLMLVLSLYALRLTLAPPPAPSPCGCGLSNQPIESWRQITVRNGLACASFAIMASIVDGGSRRRRSALHPTGAPSSPT